MKIDLDNIINKRFLIEENKSYDIIEITILEISPSKQYVKIESPNKNAKWVKILTIDFKELLN